MQKPQWFSGADLQTGGIPPAAYDLYNQRLDQFFSGYPDYLNQLQAYFNRVRRTVELRIWALNQGTCPAKDVHIFMHFPDGFELLEKSELPEQPKAPQPPEKPKSMIEKVSTATVMPSLTNMVAAMPFANAKLLSIKKTKSYEVKMHVNETKHNFLTAFDPIYVVFDSHEHARSFSVEYEIYCANAPEKQIGTIHVIVESGATNSQPRK